MKILFNMWIQRIAPCLFVLLLNACDVTETTPQDSFTDLDTATNTETNAQSNVTIENMFAEKIAIELWSGSNLKYIPEIPEVQGNDLKNFSTLEIPSLSSATLNLPDPVNVLAIVGVDFNGRYEYLTEDKFSSLGNGDALRIDDKGILKPFNNSTCTKDLSYGEIQKTTAIVKLIEGAANSIATEWDSIKAISNPLYTLLRFTNNILAGNDTLVFTELSTWTVENGVYTHEDIKTGTITGNDTTTSSTQLTLTTQFLWGSDFSGRTAEDVITEDINNPNNYFSNLSTSISGDNITFQYTEAKSLAPLLGVPVDNTNGEYEVNIIDWLKTMDNNFKSLQWIMALNAKQTQGTEKLDVTLNFFGRPSFNISVDLLASSLGLGQNPILLKLTSLTEQPANKSPLRGQLIILKDWTLKVFPSDNGAKGVAQFEVLNDSSFDFSGYISYNSDANTPANIFLQCLDDNLPIRN